MWTWSPKSSTVQDNDQLYDSVIDKSPNSVSSFKIEWGSGVASLQSSSFVILLLSFGGGHFWFICFCPHVKLMPSP